MKIKIFLLIIKNIKQALQLPLTNPAAPPIIIIIIGISATISAVLHCCVSSEKQSILKIKNNI